MTIDPFHGFLTKTRKGHPAGDSRSTFSELNDFVKPLQNQIASKNEKVNLPLLVYYPVNRAVVDIPLRIRAKHCFSLLSAFEESLTSGANFRTFFEWFREREDLKNENLKYTNSLFKTEDPQLSDPQLNAVRKALNRFMPELKNLTVRRNPLRMEIEKEGKRLTVNQLSDGEKCLMAMVGDLARRIAIVNPERGNPMEGYRSD